jgi:GTP-binding protein LepA
MVKNIRNFAIIAHVDHGKSTLADRLLEITGTVKGAHEEQMLDKNPISRERGITIKLAPVRMEYKNPNDETIRHPGASVASDRIYSKKDSIEPTEWSLQNDKEVVGNDRGEFILNLIDTPGHVDFTYEVDRTLSCVEGVVLLVDATQGIQAQTVSNAYKAIEKNLVIIPVINKIDLPSAEVDKTKKSISEFLGINENEIMEISAKTGKGVKELLEAVITKIPPPKGKQEHNMSSSRMRGSRTWIPNQVGNDRGSVGNDPTSLKELRGSSKGVVRALIFDSYYDSHKGVIAFVRVFSGSIQKNQKLKVGSLQNDFTVNDVGSFHPELITKSSLDDGEIGYVVTNLKDIHKVRVGDSLLDVKSDKPLPGYKNVSPMVFASVFTVDPNDYLNLKKALEKLYLNDSSLEFSPIYSKALGAGFRVGFLGLLHAEVVRERLEREYELDLVLTPPQVEYKIEDGKYHEPIAKILILTPEEYMSDIMNLCMNHRGKFITMDNISQISLSYEMPLSELISDFFSQLKRISAGYASLDWEFLRFDNVDADKLEILLNGDPIEEFSEIIPKDRAQDKSRVLVDRLKEFIPKQQYEVKIQAQFKGKIIASQRIAPFRKDVTAGLYGGDRTRKDKLLSKQKKGKKKMKMVGRVEIPKDAFFKLFKK